MGNRMKVDRRTFLAGTAAGASAAAIAGMFPVVAQAADEIVVGGIHDESGFLDPLNAIVESGRTPAEDLLARFEKHWSRSVDPIFTEQAY